ncbi:MAG: extracellular solute-binding protein, partial [Chloroflexota bacterium]|nr:extracellular solute-binding protein [Chloroflexota bacterium]
RALPLGSQYRQSIETHCGRCTAIMAALNVGESFPVYDGVRRAPSTPLEESRGAGTMNGLRRRHFVGSASVMLTGAALAACGAPGGAGESAPVRADLAKINRKLMVWDQPDPGRKAQVDRWSELHPNLAAEVTDVGSAGTSQADVSKFIASVASGDVADVVRFDRFNIGSYVYRQALSPLDPYIKAEKFDMKCFVEAAALEAQGSTDKQQYGIPISIDNRPFLWNKMHFRQIGVDPEQPPATWDQLKEYALKLTRSNAGTITRIGWSYRPGLSGSSLTYLYGFLNGAEFLSADGRKAQLNHPKVIEAAQWVYELLEAEGGVQRHDEFQKTFGANENHPLFGELLSMTHDTQTALDRIARYKPDLDFGIGPNPVRKAGDRGATWSGGHAWIVAKGAKNPEVSWAMIAHLVGQESILSGQEVASRQRPAGQKYVPPMSAQPAVDKVVFEQFKTGIPAIDKGLAFALDYMKVSKFRPITVAGAELYGGGNTAWDEILAKKKGVKQAFDDANATAQAALDQVYGASK